MNYRVGSIVQALQQFSSVAPGALGVVKSFARDKKTDAVTDFTVDFGTQEVQITDLTTICPYTAPRRKKREARA